METSKKPSLPLHTVPERRLPLPFDVRRLPLAGRALREYTPLTRVTRESKPVLLWSEVEAEFDRWPTWGHLLLVAATTGVACALVLALVWLVQGVR